MELFCVVSKMILEKTIPFVHSVDLVVVVSLTWTFWEISFSPFSETSCDLFGSNWWIFTVVSVPDWVSINFSLSSFRCTTMWELIFIIESTSLVSSFEVSFHTFSISLEFSDPGLLRLEEWEMVGHNFIGEFNQSVQSLKWVSWWDLLFIILAEATAIMTASEIYFSVSFSTPQHLTVLKSYWAAFLRHHNFCQINVVVD